jgi:hypothetical protein
MWDPGGNGNGSTQQHLEQQMTLPRPHLEGCAQLGAPNYQPGTDKWAECLGKTTRMMEKDNLIYEERLKELNR